MIIKNNWTTNKSITKFGTFEIKLHPQDDFLKPSYDLWLDDKVLVEDKPADYLKGFGDGILMIMIEESLKENKNNG